MVTSHAAPRKGRGAPGAALGAAVGLLPLLLLAASSSASSQISDLSSPKPETGGSYSLRISSRTFDAPLFGTRTTAIYRLFGSQSFESGASLTAFLDSGFPNFETDWGLHFERLPFGDGQAALEIGDFFHERLLPSGHTPVSRDLYPLQGFDLRLENQRTEWSVFGGRAKRFRGLPGREVETSVLFGARVLHRQGLNHFGATVTGLDRSTFLEPQAGDRAGILGLQYYRQFSPWTRLFSEASVSDAGGLGARLGIRRRLLRGELVAGAFAFQEELPFVDPIYRPGEQGLEIYGNYRVNGTLDFFGHVDYLENTAIDRRSQVRADVGLGWSAGGKRPYFSLRYSRNEVALESSSIAEPDSVVDRLYLQMSKSAADRFFDLSVEHLMRSTTAVERSQALLTLNRVLTRGSILEGSALLQRQGDSDFGLTTEASIERPFGRHLYYLLGLGGAVLEQARSTTGEGAVRLGISSRALRRGLFGRLELVLPFSIGLERSQLGGSQLRVDIGHRFSWSSLRQLRSAFGPVIARKSYGAIEGAVLRDGEGVGQVSVYINGQPRARSGPDGSFRIKRVPVGAVTVSLDLLELDARLQVTDGPARRAVIHPKATTEVLFVLRELSYFQGSLLACIDGEEQPLRGAALTLLGKELSYNLTTSKLGGFQFGDVEPGIYEMIVDPESLDPTIEANSPLSWTVDLTADLAGRLFKIDCR